MAGIACGGRSILMSVFLGLGGGQKERGRRSSEEYSVRMGKKNCSSKPTLKVSEVYFVIYLYD